MSGLNGFTSGMSSPNGDDAPSSQDLSSNSCPPSSLEVSSVLAVNCSSNPLLYSPTTIVSRPMQNDLNHPRSTSQATDAHQHSCGNLLNPHTNLVNQTSGSPPSSQCLGYSSVFSPGSSVPISPGATREHGPPFSRHFTGRKFPRNFTSS